MSTIFLPPIGLFHVDLTGTADKYPVDGEGASSATPSAAHWLQDPLPAQLPNGYDVLVERIEYLTAPTGAAAAETVTLTALDAGGMTMTFKSPYMPGTSTATARQQEIHKVFKSGFKAKCSATVTTYRVWYRIVQKSGPLG